MTTGSKRKHSSTEEDTGKELPTAISSNMESFLNRGRQKVSLGNILNRGQEIYANGK
jgi:hypothetical protein